MPSHFIPLEEQLMPSMDDLSFIPGTSARDLGPSILMQEFSEQFHQQFTQTDEDEESPSMVAKHMEEVSERFMFC